MASAAHDIAQYLDDQGHGTVGTDIYRGATPQDNDGALIVVIPTGGGDSIKAFGGKVAARQPRLQIMVRSALLSVSGTVAATITKADAIVASLDNKGPLTLGGTVWLFIEVTGDVMTMAPDERGRRRFSINVTGKRVA